MRRLATELRIMDDFVKMSAEERRIFFEGTSGPENMEAQITEKDFWVCWTLKRVVPDCLRLASTSFSKAARRCQRCSRSLERFSEDIDVSIDRSYLGFGGANEPEAGASNKEKQRRIEALKAACQRKIGGDPPTALQAAIKSKVRH